MREGDVGDELIVIVEGSVRVVRYRPNGAERLVRRYEAGDHIGELAVLREAPRAATVIAEDAGMRGLVIGGAGIEVDPARATGSRDGDARRAGRPDHPPVARGRMTEGPVVRRPLPTGTVTFMRTDIEGSMAMIRALGPPGTRSTPPTSRSCATWSSATAGSSCGPRATPCSRRSPRQAPRSVPRSKASAALETEPWPDGGRIRVRIGLHSGEAHLAGDDYGGFDVNRAARIAGVGHGGQIVASATTQALVAGSLPPEVTFRDLGQHALKDVPLPERLFQVDAPGRRTGFPHSAWRGRPSAISRSG